MTCIAESSKFFAFVFRVQPGKYPDFILYSFKISYS